MQNTAEICLLLDAADATDFNVLKKKFDKFMEEKTHHVQEHYIWLKMARGTSSTRDGMGKYYHRFTLFFCSYLFFFHSLSVRIGNIGSFVQHSQSVTVLKQHSISLSLIQSRQFSLDTIGI